LDFLLRRRRISILDLYSGFLCEVNEKIPETLDFVFPFFYFCDAFDMVGLAGFRAGLACVMAYVLPK